jgi:hypothetical protein
LMHADSPSYLMEDKDYGFLKTTFLGCEVELSIWNIMVYCLVDFGLQNAAAAAFVCFITNYALTILRSYGGKFQISKKTLIDERFLSE